MATGFVNFSNYARFFGVSAIVIAMTACSDSGESSGSSQSDQTQHPDVELPPNWFPESLNAGSDGTIYVGSFARGHDLQCRHALSQTRPRPERKHWLVVIWRARESKPSAGFVPVTTTCSDNVSLSDNSQNRLHFAGGKGTSPLP